MIFTRFVDVTGSPVAPLAAAIKRYFIGKFTGCDVIGDIAQKYAVHF